jgi:hypothetical protein
MVKLVLFQEYKDGQHMQINKCNTEHKKNKEQKLLDHLK